jgi:hypothetical protein
MPSAYAAGLQPVIACGQAASPALLCRWMVIVCCGTRLLHRAGAGATRAPINPFAPAAPAHAPAAEPAPAAAAQPAAAAGSRARPQPRMPPEGSPVFTAGISMSSPSPKSSAAKVTAAPDADAACSSPQRAPRTLSAAADCASAEQSTPPLERGGHTEPFPGQGFGSAFPILSPSSSDAAQRLFVVSPGQCSSGSRKPRHCSRCAPAPHAACTATCAPASCAAVCAPACSAAQPHGSRTSRALRVRMWQHQLRPVLSSLLLQVPEPGAGQQGQATARLYPRAGDRPACSDVTCCRRSAGAAYCRGHRRLVWCRSPPWRGPCHGARGQRIYRIQPVAVIRAAARCSRRRSQPRQCAAPPCSRRRSRPRQCAAPPGHDAQQRPRWCEWPLSASGRPRAAHRRAPWPRQHRSVRGSAWTASLAAACTGGCL